MNGNDSVYFLNRIMCDPCVTIVGGPNPCDTCYAAKNRPQFLQRQVTVSSSGIANFRDTGNIVINTLAALSNSWLFDSTQNISATVIAVSMDSVFGNYDSVKTMLLSSGDTLRLSKNFGVIQYPNHYGLNSYYRLVGIEGRNLGEHVPKFADFFNFDVGDMFEYHRHGSLGSDCNFDERRKYSITSRQVTIDSIVYLAHGIFRRQEWPVGFWSQCDTFLYVSSNYNITFIYKDSLDHFDNKYNREAFNLANHLQLNGHDNVSPCGDNDSAYDRVNIYKDSNLVISKSFGIAFGGLNGGYDNYYHYTEYQYGDTLYMDPSLTGLDFWAFTSTYKAGLGLTDYVVSACFEGIDIDHMVAYRKGNDTVGVFTPDSLFTVNLGKNIFQNQFSISPNPASVYLTLKLPYQTHAEISLCDVQGKILMSETVSGEKAEIDVSKIENGLYFLLIKTGAGTFSQKVVVLH
jgi:hypothetical protein